LTTPATSPAAAPIPPPPDQGALLARLRTNDPAAFDDLVLLTQDRLYAVALRMLGRPDDAMDAVQDAYLSAFKALARFEGGSSLSTWLHRITVNACLMKLRSRRRRPEVLIDDLLPAFKSDGHQAEPARAWNPAPAPRDGASSGVEARELHAVVREKIDSLPEPLRDVVLLRDIEDLDTATTAEMLGITPSMVKTRLHRARMALRALLEPHFTEKPA
jgi:RNA polymerase sigma-70 factor (ECF subfamily)